ncbi:MAG: hypothetical protein IPG18_04730 [Saprospiraceae bacterium]|nr:hypothetical protein [Saprospiraceae bacterium]
MCTIPFDVSLIGIFPHMHYLGKNWEVYIENPDGSKTNLIKINDWDFNWQGGYYFDRYKIAERAVKCMLSQNMTTAPAILQIQAIRPDLSLGVKAQR